MQEQWKCFSVNNFKLIWYTISAFVGVQYSVNFQNARRNNKDNNLHANSVKTRQLYFRTYFLDVCFLQQIAITQRQYIII
jgi:hypothetical protein